jgi:hypothetical protein
MVRMGISVVCGNRSDEGIVSSTLPNRAGPQEILCAENFFASNHANNSVNVKSPVITHRSQTDHFKTWCENDLEGTG